MIKGAIFDVDGTLLDSMGIWKDVGVRYLNSIGIEAEPDLENILFTMSIQEGAQYVKSIIICHRKQMKSNRTF